MRNRPGFVAFAAAAAALSGCGANSPHAPKSYQVGGTVSGLTGTGLVLQDNGTDNLAISGNGPFVFPTPLAAGQSYSVTIATQPSASPPARPQTCFVSLGTGTSQGTAQSSVQVNCVSNAARFVYVVDSGSNGISGFSIDNRTGALTAISGSPFPAGTGPISLTVHPSGKFAYASNGGDNTISEYTIDPATGGLASISGSPLPVPPSTTPLTGLSILPVVFDPSGKLALVGNPTVPFNQADPNPQPDNLDVYSVDTSSGALTEIAGSPLTTGSDFPSTVVVNASDTVAYIVNGDWQVGADQCSISAFSIASNAASVTAISGSPFHLPPSCRMTGPFALLLGPSGAAAYLTDGDGGAFPLQWLTLDATTGAVTGGGKPSAGMASAASAAALDPSGKFLYLAGPATTGNQYLVYEYSVDTPSGALTPIGNVATGAASPVTIDPTGKFVYVATTTAIYAYSIDAASGALTAVSGSPFTVASSSDTIGTRIAIDPSGRFAYVPSAATDAVYALSIDPGTGALTAVPGSPFQTGAGPKWIAFLD